MKYSDARCLVYKYLELFTDSKITYQIAHNDKLLPAMKVEIVLAYKVFFSFVGIFRCMSKDDVDFLLQCINRLNSFVEEHEAQRINVIHKRLSKKGRVSEDDLQACTDFLSKATMCDEHDEVVNVLMETQKAIYNWIVPMNRNINDHRIYEYVYEKIIGINYQDIYGDEFYSLGLPVYNTGVSKKGDS